jgi:hypothetical protein
MKIAGNGIPSETSRVNFSIASLVLTSKQSMDPPKRWYKMPNDIVLPKARFSLMTFKEGLSFLISARIASLAPILISKSSEMIVQMYYPKMWRLLFFELRHLHELRPFVGNQLISTKFELVLPIILHVNEFKPVSALKISVCITCARLVRRNETICS